MSGLEVIGLVLGVLPILAAALDKIQDGHHSSLFHYQPRIQKFARDLDREHVQFRHTVERILDGIIDDADFEEFLLNPEWKDEDGEKLLQKRLGGEVYQTYMKTLHRIHKLLATLSEVLDLEALEAFKPNKVSL
jgi:hypothetical protein